MDQQIRFCTAADGVRIAYCVTGQGPPLVFVRGWTSHLHVFWDDPYYRAYFQALAQVFTVVRFDMRGNGLSDRDVGEVSLAGMVADIDAVVVALGLPPAVLYGQCFGGPAAIAYAAAHPDRVSHLILDGTYADGRRLTKPERRERLLGTLRDLPEASRVLFSHYTYPLRDATWPRLLTQRDEAMGPDMALQLYTLCFRFDVTEVLPQISMPTLVMHRRETLAVPFRLGRELASCIDGARFVALEGAAHNPWHERPEEAIVAIGAFLGAPLRFVPDDEASPPRARSARTILVSEIVRDAATGHPSHDAMRQHDLAVRQALAEHGGIEARHTENGMITTFASASRAVDCAAAIQRALSSRAEAGHVPPRVRIGLNTGEPLGAGADLGGAAVQLAASVCASAAPGAVLLTNVVRELCAGKSFTFEDRGVVPMPDLDEPMRIFEFRWR